MRTTLSTFMQSFSPRVLMRPLFQTRLARVNSALVSLPRDQRGNPLDASAYWSQVDAAQQLKRLIGGYND